MPILLSSDLYEGTRMAKVTDFSTIRQLLQPLEESGTLVRRTDKEVWSHALFCTSYCISVYVFFLNSQLIITCLMFISYSKRWIHSLLWRERVILLHVLLCFLSMTKSAGRLLLLLFLLIAVDKDRAINYLVRLWCLILLHFSACFANSVFYICDICKLGHFFDSY